MDEMCPYCNGKGYTWEWYGTYDPAYEITQYAPEQQKCSYCLGVGEVEEKDSNNLTKNRASNIITKMPING